MDGYNKISERLFGLHIGDDCLSNVAFVTDKIIVCKNYQSDELCALSRFDGSFIISKKINDLLRDNKYKSIYLLSRSKSLIFLEMINEPSKR